MTRWMCLALIAAGSLFGQGLEAVKAEPNLEKRAQAALKHADEAITASRKAYMESEYKTALTSLEEVQSAVELCLESLNETGKNARRSPKHFKRAEKDIRSLLRRLDSLESDFGVDDRPAVKKVEARLQAIHDELVIRIMGKKK